MKEKYFFIIVYALLLFALGVSLYNIFNPRQNTLGQIYKSYYDPLKYNISVIETNMNAITTSNDEWDWYKLKEINVKDSKLKKTYNMLVTDIRTCYLLSNDLENKTYKNVKILNLEDRRSVSGKDVLQLQKNENCLKNFDKYSALVLSDNQKTSNKIKNQINIIIDYKPDSYNHETDKNIPNEAKLIDFINEEGDTISKIASLSSWLKIEYYSYKN